MIDLNQLPAGTPVWISGALLILTALLTLSERAAKLKGPLGSAARWWTSRQVREVHQKKDLDREIENLVDARVEARMEGVNETIQDLRTQVDELRSDLANERRERREERTSIIQEYEAELKRLRRENRLRHSYTLWVTGVLRTVEIWAADHGYDLPPPPFRTFHEWMREQEPTARYPPGEN